MGRKVTVGLEADVGKFIGPVEASKKAIDGLDRSVEGLDRDLDKLPPDAAKAAAAMKLLGGDVSTVGEHFKSIGDKSAGMNVLDARIRSTRAEVRKLTDEFIKTGDVDVFSRLGKSSGDLRVLTDLRKTLTREMQGGAKDGILSGLLSGFQGLPGSTFAKIAVPVGLALAIPLAASIGGALSALTGGGVATLGVLGAVLGNPDQFKTAWSAVLADLKKQFFDASAPFVGPALDALRTIGPLVRSWHLDEIFANAAKFVEPLMHGLGGFGTGLMKGVGDLVKDGGPAVEALSDGMVRLGEAAGNAFSSIAAGSEGGATALHDLVTVVSLTIEGFGKMVEGAENAYQFMHDHPWMTAAYTGGLSLAIAYVGELDSVSHRLGTTQLGLAEAAREAGHAFSEQGDDITAATQLMNTANQTMDTFAAQMVSKIFTATMSLDEATLSWHKSLTQVNETLKENIKNHKDRANAINEDTVKGQENVSVIYQAVTANMQQYQAMIAAGASATDAASAYEKNTAALEANLRKAGLTTAQIDELIGKYRAIPHDVDSNLAINGLTKAINDLADLIRKINGIHDKDFTVTEHIRTVDERGNIHSSKTTFNAAGGVRYAQTGLIIPPSSGGTVIAGEPQTGGEALIPLQGISQGRAMDLMTIAGAGYGLDVMPRWRSTSGPAAMPPHGGGGGYTDLGPLLAEVRGLRGALAGMQVVLDGQRVGAIQGRGADLIRRGG